MNNYAYMLRAFRPSDGYATYLYDSYYGYSDSIHEWEWNRHHGELFVTEAEAKSRLNTKAVRELRQMKDAEGRPNWKFQIVRVPRDDRNDWSYELMQVVWPKKDVPVLDRLAAV